MKIWQGTPPKECDVCQRDLNDVFVDGNTQTGLWAILCPNCHSRISIGIGTGRGQRYQCQNNAWVKVAG